MANPRIYTVVDLKTHVDQHSKPIVAYSTIAHALGSFSDDFTRTIWIPHVSGFRYIACYLSVGADLLQTSTQYWILTLKQLDKGNRDLVLGTFDQSLNSIEAYQPIRLEPDVPIELLKDRPVVLSGEITPGTFSTNLTDFFCEFIYTT